MNTVQVKNTVIGEGRPKICVPIVGKTKTDILEEAKKITTLPVDVVEWRVDWFDDVFATEKVLETAKELQEVLKDIPVLLTFRTSKEGGEKEISVNDYAALNIAAAQSGYVDLIDVEAFTGDEVVKTIINAAHEAGVKAVSYTHLLWVGMTVSVSMRYKEGKKAMKSLLGGMASFRLATFLSVLIIPVVSFFRPIFGVGSSITLMFQAFVCARIGMDYCKSDRDKMIAGVMAAVLAAQGLSLIHI